MTTEVGLIHRRGCPAVGHRVGDEGSRVERFRVVAPDGARLVTTRCVDCAEQVVVPEEAVEHE